MGNRQVRRIGRTETEKLLSGSQPSADREALVRVLRLAAAPAHPEELAGHQARVDELVRAYWVAAQESPIDAPRQPSRVRTPRLNRSQTLVLRLAGAFVLLLFLGGGVLATGTGRLPASVQHGAHQILSAVGVPVPDASSSRTPGPRSSHPAASASSMAGVGSPTASPATLCQQWLDAQAGRGPALTPAALRGLEAMAGGSDQVAGYCTAVLAQPGATAPGTAPAAGDPTATPAPADSTTHPGKGKPSKSKGK